MTKSLLFFPILAIFSASAAFSQTNRTVFNSIKTEQTAANKIKISWKNSSTNIKSILIYRDEKPILNLSKLEPIAELPPETAVFTDTIKFYGFYCYAVIAKNADGTTESTLIPAVNSSAEGVRIARQESRNSPAEIQKSYPEGVLREQPLPRIAMFEKEPKKRKSISEKTRKKAEELSLPRPVKTRLSPYIFEEDLAESTSGDDFVLFEILKSSFIKKDYKSAAEKLSDFLRVKRDKSAENRARFYLAESWHFLGDQKNAVQIFLQIEEKYPILSRKWIDASLDEYTIPENE